jgi:hypothetical protein
MPSQELAPYRRVYRPLDRPPRGESRSEGRSADSLLFRPFHQRHRPITDCQSARDAGIPTLLSPCGPPAVRHATRRPAFGTLRSTAPVSGVVVDAVDGVSGLRPRSHVADEVRVRVSPPRADRNTAPAVIGEILLIRIRTPGENGPPDIVLRRVPAPTGGAVSRGSRRRALLVVASARRTVSAHQIRLLRHHVCPATADALPVPTLSATGAEHFGRDRKATEPQPGQIDFDTLRDSHDVTSCERGCGLVRRPGRVRSAPGRRILPRRRNPQSRNPAEGRV